MPKFYGVEEDVPLHKESRHFGIAGLGEIAAALQNLEMILVDATRYSRLLP